MRELTGEETAADIVRMAVEEFSKSQLALEWQIEISYQRDIPILTYRAQVKNDRGEFACQYRLDKMLLTVYPECEKIYDEIDEHGIWGDNDPLKRAKGIRSLALYAMNMMLNRLLIYQVALFEENYEDTVFLTAGITLTAIADAIDANSGKAVKAANEGVRIMLDKRVDAFTKKKRELLVGLLNRIPKLTIPTGPGRPRGSKKPEDVKAQEAAEFETKVEVAIRKLISPQGEMPTKKAVAKELGIGGVSSGGTDSSLTNFGRKLKGLKIDYDAIVERVKLDK